MSDQPTTYPAKYAEIVGNHRLVGWGSYDTLRDSIHMRVFGWMVRAATPVVEEYHGDLLIDADTMRQFLDENFTEGHTNKVTWMYCVRHSGTNFGSRSARLTFESLAYDTALYLFEVQVDGRGEWHLSIDLLDARPDRPGATASTEDMSAEALGLSPVEEKQVEVYAALSPATEQQQPGIERYIDRLKSNLS